VKRKNPATKKDECRYVACLSVPDSVYRSHGIGVLETLGHFCMVRALALTDTAAVMTIDFFRLIWGA
jgi:DNA gyrase inhibitor GyrI